MAGSCRMSSITSNGSGWLEVQSPDRQLRHAMSRWRARGPPHARIGLGRVDARDVLGVEIDHVERRPIGTQRRRAAAAMPRSVPARSESASSAAVLGDLVDALTRRIVAVGQWGLPESKTQVHSPSVGGTGDLNAAPESGFSGQLRVWTCRVGRGVYVAVTQGTSTRPHSTLLTIRGHRTAPLTRSGRRHFPHRTGAVPHRVRPPQTNSRSGDCAPPTSTRTPQRRRHRRWARQDSNLRPGDSESLQVRITLRLRGHETGALQVIPSRRR